LFDGNNVNSDDKKNNNISLTIKRPNTAIKLHSGSNRSNSFKHFGNNNIKEKNTVKNNDCFLFQEILKTLETKNQMDKSKKLTINDFKK